MVFYDDENVLLPDLEDEECSHMLGCQCETCLQNHPEWDVLFGDGDYYDWDTPSDEWLARRSGREREERGMDSENDQPKPYKYDVGPERVRFQVPYGVDVIDLTPSDWEKISRELDNALHNVKPLAENELSWIIQRLDGIRDYGTNKPLVQLVNMAKRADGLGYIFRLYEPSRDREWNISTYGELDAMEHAVRER